MVMCYSRRLQLAAAIVSLVFGSLTCSAAQPSRSQAAAPSLPGPYSLSQAMTFLYGSYNSFMVESWRPKRSSKYPSSWPNAVNVYPLLDMPYQEENYRRHLLVTWAVPSTDSENYGCHFCGILLGITVFEECSSGWCVQASDLQLGEYGTFGRPPTVYLQPIGPKRFGIAMVTGSGAQGWVDQSISILVPQGRRFAEIFSGQLLYMCGLDPNNASGPPRDCVAFDATLDTQQISGDYYELLLTKRAYLPAKNANSTKTERVTVSRFKFDGAKYTAVNLSPQ